jgi:trans-aconitate methyltransferase
MRLYRDYARWYRLVDPPEDHLDESDTFRLAFEEAARPAPETLLELGAGAGHNALHLKRRFRCMLTDLSEDMLALSRELNPECDHGAGDMRTLRLDRTFDVVLVHDAVAYMLTEDDLAATARTAFIHTRPGGAAIFAPDRLRDTFHEGTEVDSGQDKTRTLHYLAWVWDPDPADDTYRVEYAFLVRENGIVDAFHEHHEEGLFSRVTWLRILDSVGFQTQILPRPIGDGAFDEVFLCRK